MSALHTLTPARRRLHSTTAPHAWSDASVVHRSRSIRRRPNDPGPKRSDLASPNQTASGTRPDPTHASNATQERSTPSARLLRSDRLAQPLAILPARSTGHISPCLAHSPTAGATH